ncbi:MAG: ABC transporter substrate-binding protein [Peptococcaceae bacterium]|nr:ABC transporter substrate-binding protein [Peptococcaceae bacterium]
MKKSLLKKVLSATVLTSMLFSLTGCSGNGSQQADPADDKLKVGIVQMIDNGAFEEMREGFIAELEAKGYGEDKVDIVYKNAQGDATNLNTICQEMVDSDVDLVAAIATPAAQAMVAMESDIPVIFISVGNPVGAGVITEMEHPDKNATGTSNAIPINEIFELSDSLTPGMQTYGLLYCTSEVNSVTTAENAKAYLTERGLHYVEKIVTNSSEVQQAAQSLVGDVDAIFVPNDSVIQAAMPLVAEVARDAKIPVYGSSAVMVDSGAFATVAITDTEIGAISADMAIEYLEGKAIADIPALVVPANAIVVNEDTMETLGITLTDEQKTDITFVKDTAN